MKSCNIGTHWHCFSEAIPMCTHDICSHGENHAESTHWNCLSKAISISSHNIHFHGRNHAVGSHWHYLQEVISLSFHNIWATTWENIPSDTCIQWRFKSACASVHSEQSLQTLHPWLSKCTQWLGSVVQSIVSLTSLLMTKSLTVVAKVFSNTCTLIFLLQKMWVAFAMQKLLTFFQQKISMYLPYFKIVILMSR